MSGPYDEDGAIMGNEFSGTTIDELADNPFFQTEGASAQFAGGFYGGEAEEAGGMFEIVGGRTQDPGRFVGALGGRKDDE